MERLLGGATKAAPGAGQVSAFTKTFPSLGAADASAAPADLLTRVADLGDDLGPTDAPAADTGSAEQAASASAGASPLLADAADMGPGVASPGVASPGVASPGVAPAPRSTATAAPPTTGSATPSLAPAPAPTAPTAAVAPKKGTPAAAVFAKHTAMVGTLTSKMSPAQVEDLDAFKANWAKNKARYEAVAAKAGVPAPLVAAIHWRESTGNFKTYLHQGDPLGKPATHVPKNIPVFTVWEDAAVHALTMPDKAQVHDDLGMTKDTTSAASMATYAEFYNGLGYNAKGRASPYVYSGTDAYKGGKFIADHVYSARAKDQQLGVLAMVGSIGGMDSTIKKQPAAGPSGWDSLLAGRTVRHGARGPLVKEIQTRLAAAGYPCGTDSSFGPGVEKAVRAFQKANGLTEDGIVGKDVAIKLASPAAPTAAPTATPAGPAAPTATPAGPAAPTATPAGPAAPTATPAGPTATRPVPSLPTAPG